MAIPNGKDRSLQESSAFLPNMSSSLKTWFRKITLIKVTKTVVNFKVVETENSITFQGVWQPASPKTVSMKPEGQRMWSWFTLHCDIGVVLNPDEIVSYYGNRYRVKSQSLYSEYGYIEYELIQDYT